MADWPLGVGRVFLEEIDSTNSAAAREAAKGVAGPVWIAARRQTAARGRRGRVWLAPEGNLFASLLMRPAGAPGEAALRSFTAALALRDAVIDAGGSPDRLTLKWPNDVLLDGCKLAGILLEAADRGTALIIGFGVNLRHAPPPEAVEPGAVRPISLSLAGVCDTPEEFLPRLAVCFARWEARFQAEGFEPVRAEWLRHAARIGQPVVARMVGRETRGIFSTVDATGALVLDTGSGVVAISAADIQFS